MGGAHQSVFSGWAGASWPGPHMSHEIKLKIVNKMKEAKDVLLKNPDGIGVAVLHVDETTRRYFAPFVLVYYI